MAFFQSLFSMKYEKNQLNSSCGCEKQSTDTKSSLSSSENDFAITSFRNYESLCGPESNTINSRQPRSASLADVNTQLSGPDVVVQQYKNGEYSILPHDYNDWPTVENGILTFRDEEHFDNYYNYLADMSSKPGNKMNQKEFYDLTEDKIGFLSLRKVTDEEFDIAAEIGWKSLEDIPDKHFLNGDLYRSFLNPKEQVKIGNKITRFINKTIAVTVPATSSVLVDVIERLPFSTTMEQVLRLQNIHQDDLTIEDWNIISTNDTFPTNQQNSFRTDVELNSFEVRNTQNGKVVIDRLNDRIDQTNVIYTPTGANKSEYRYEMLGEIHEKSQCYSPLEVALSGFSVRYKKGPLERGTILATSQIRWGDGSLDLLASGGSTGTTHVYTTKGLKTITIDSYYRFSSTNVQLVASREFKVSVGCFYSASHTSSWHYGIRGDTYRVVMGKHWITQWRNGRGKERSEIGATSMALHWERKGRDWAYRPYYKGTLHQEIWVTKNKQNCEFNNFFHSFDIGVYGHNSLSRNHVGDGFFAWEGITSRHTLYTFDDGKPGTQVTFLTKPC